MAGFLICLLNMSLQASVIICIILVVRVVFNRIHTSKKYTRALWSIPYFCMVCPWKVKGPYSFWTKSPVREGAERIWQALTEAQNGAMAAGGTAVSGTDASADTECDLFCKTAEAIGLQCLIWQPENGFLGEPRWPLEKEIQKAGSGIL